jgi:hypothetical protein
LGRAGRDQSLRGAGLSCTRKRFAESRGCVAERKILDHYLLCYTLEMKKVNSSKSRKVREAAVKYRVDKESDMTLIEQIQKRLLNLSPDKRREVLDFIAFLQLHSHKRTEPSTDVKRGKQIKELLNQLAAMDVFSDIVDPVDWQRKIRKDRTLPGRPA